MMTSRVTLLVEEEGANVDGEEGVREAVALEHLKKNYASLRLTVPASIAPMKGKGSKEGKWTLKWRKSLVIAKEKVSLSWVVVSL